MKARLFNDVLTAFACLPYENLTKIIARSERGSAQNARRYPKEVIDDHLRWGTGGTCFSLTAALLFLVRSLGFDAAYILADRGYGKDTHCALRVSIDGRPHILDPGYLITVPVPMPCDGERVLAAGFNRFVLAPAESPDRISLHTVHDGTIKYRLTYKTVSIDENEFCRVWDASFEWDMMRYPLLTRVAGTKQYYVNGSMLRIIDGDSIERRAVSSEHLVEAIADGFHLHPSVVARAVSLLKERGSDGETAGC